MAGAPSHLELFDYKPQLAKFDGTLPPPELLKGYRAAFINPNSTLLGPKFKFDKYGQSGSRSFGVAAALSARSWTTCHREIDGDGRVQPCARPASDEHRHHAVWPPQHGRVGDSTGWATKSKDLPAFVVFSSGKKGPSGGNSCWGSGFLPTVYQGVQFRSSGDPVLYLSNPPGVDAEVQRDSLDAIRSLNKMRQRSHGRSGNRHAHQLL